MKTALHQTMGLRFPFLLAVLTALPVVGDAHALRGEEIDGFTEPFRSIELAFDETGTLEELLVEEGAQVKAGDPIARLDDRVQRLQLELAEHQAKSTSALQAAEQSYGKRDEISNQIRRLRGSGHAAESELIRADMELAIARSKFLAAQEEAAGREIDRRRAEVLLERRTLTAPFDGTITMIYRRRGEFVSPVHPEIVKLVDVQKLFAVFNVSSQRVGGLSSGQQVSVKFGSQPPISGTLHTIGVETDAQSGTVRLKVELDNREGKLRSGEQCYLQLP